MMQPACAPFSRRMRVSLRVSMPAIATISAALEELRQRFGSRASCCEERQVADDEAGGDGSASDSEVFGRDAGVADVGIGQRDDLAGVGRVGQDFLIARHRGIENDFAGRVACSSDRTAAEHRAVRERQHCGVASPCISPWSAYRFRQAQARSRWNLGGLAPTVNRLVQWGPRPEGGFYKTGM